MSATLTRPTTRIEPERPTRSVEETAVMLGYSAMTIHRRIMSGEIRSLKIGRRRLIPVEEIDRLLAPQTGR